MKKRIEPQEWKRIKQTLKLDGFRIVVDHVEALEFEIEQLQKIIHEQQFDIHKLEEEKWKR